MSQNPPPDRAQPSPGAAILIAEDHADSRDALRTLLDAMGYRVVVAVNGREAVEAALSGRPDLILMDVMMPEMDGFQATRTLRANPEFRQVPILALTAMEGAREQVLAAGCNDYVAKPIDVRTFLAKVEGWIEAGRTVRP
jgi:CheY-like chemotaxis protein